MPERTFTISQFTAAEAAEQLDGRHPSVSCPVCGMAAQVLPDVEEGGDVGHFDDLGEYGTGVLSDHQQLIHNALSRWSQAHAQDAHSPEEHAAFAAGQAPPREEIKL